MLNLHRVHGPDGALQQLNRHPQLFADGGDFQEPERLSQQRMLALQCLGGKGRAQALRTLEPREQQGIGQCLRVGVRKLRVVRLREQQPAPLIREGPQRAVGTTERLLHLVAEDTGQRRQELRESPRRARHNRLPVEELAEQTRQIRQALTVERSRAAFAHVIGNADPRDQLAGVVEAPLRAVRIDQVGQRLESEPLRPVGARETLRPGAQPRPLQLDVTGK